MEEKKAESVTIPTQVFGVDYGRVSQGLNRSQLRSVS